MNIIHISLGLPPLRTGGLTRYCCELMEAQVSHGHEVSLIFPGRFLPGGVRFFRGNWHGIYTYELINPLPVALTYGVADPEHFLTSCPDVTIFERVVRDISPDVIHVHSFMGIYREFFEVAKRLGIPMVFTTHDYYPMCPRCTFVNASGCYCGATPSARSCAICCQGGMTKRKSMVMQSGLYALLKHTGFLKTIALAVKGRMTTDKSKDMPNFSNAQIDSYARLLDYNRSIFNLFNLVLANSLSTEQIYRKEFPASSYKHVRISHDGLIQTIDNRGSIRSTDSFVMGYFGGKKGYKGYDVLIDAARLLQNSSVNFELRLYGDSYGDTGIACALSCGKVNPNEIIDVLRQLDLVIVPSICEETFGFVVLEALCAGVRVICSDAVGARELLNSDSVFNRGDSKALANLIMSSVNGKLADQHLPADYPITMGEQVEMMDRCYEKASKLCPG